MRIVQEKMELYGIICDTCEYFFGAWSDDRTFSVHGLYEGFCKYSKKRNFKT